MLILTRLPDESIRVGDEITITVLGVKGNQVRVGIDAPAETLILREEIYERVQRERDHP